MSNAAVIEISAKRTKLPSDTSVTVIRKCNGTKWRSASEVADRAGIAEGDVARVMHVIRTTHKHRAKVETQRIGGEIHYRIFKQDKTVSVEELTTKLTPIIKGLEVEGKKHVAQRVEAEIARLAVQLKRLLDEWAE